MRGTLVVYLNEFSGKHEKSQQTSKKMLRDFRAGKRSTGAVSNVDVPNEMSDSPSY